MRNLFILIILLCMFSDTAQAAIELTISDSSGITRTNQYVSYAVPLAYSDSVTAISGLAISTDSGGTSTVDAQFDIISRYDDDGDDADTGDPIRTVLCTFKATVSASGSSTYYLQTSGGSGNASGSNMATDDTGYVEIDTSTMRARISETEGNLFEQVILDTDSDSSYADETAVIDSPTDDGWFIYSDEDGTGKLYASNLGDTPTVTIHYNGPLMALVEVHGNFKNATTYLADSAADGKMEYKIFYKFFNDADYVLVNAVLRAEDHYGFGAAGYTFGSDNENIDIDYSYLRTSLNSFTPTEVNFSSGISGDDCADTSSPSGTYVLNQDHANNNQSESDAEASPNFSYSITNCTGTTSGTRFDGWAGMDDGSNGVSVATRWFWEKWPKGITVDATNDRIDAYLWPNEDSDHIFMGAIWKTHEMIYMFGDSATLDDEIAQLKNPLRIVSGNLTTSNFFNHISPIITSNTITFNNNPNEKLQPAIDKWEDQTLGFFDSSNVDSGADFDDLRESRPITWSAGIYSGEYASMYGWYEFGDFVRSTTGFGSQNYDWGTIALMAWLRYGDKTAAELADQMARQYGDVLVIHDEGSTSEMSTSAKTSFDVHGGQRTEADALCHVNSFDRCTWDNAPGDYSHTWNNHMALQYMLTGDPFYKDVMDDIGSHLKWNYSNLTTRGETQTNTDRICNSTNDCYVEAVSRTYTLAIDGGVSLWYATGESDYLIVAKNIFNNAVLSNEEANSGYLFQQGTDEAHMLYEGLKIAPIIHLHSALDLSGETTTKAAIESFMTRSAEWMRDDVYTHWETIECGTYGTGANDGKYFPYTSKDEWDSVTEYTHDASDGFLIDGTYSFVQADLFAFVYSITGVSSWIDLARTVFKDYMAYGGTFPIESYTYLTINTSDPLSSDAFSSLPSPGWLKDGKIVSNPMYYLHTESQLNFGKLTSNQSGTPISFGNSGTPMIITE